MNTGQHYDDNMSAVFFKDMDIHKPKYNLGLGGLTQSAMTGRIMESFVPLYIPFRDLENTNTIDQKKTTQQHTQTRYNTRGNIKKR